MYDIIFSYNREGSVIVNRLFVIGNGFDIAHGLPTKYSNFMEYLLTLTQKPQFIIGNYALLDSIAPQDQAKRRFYETMSKYIPEQDLWCSFEEALGYLDYEQIQEDNSCYFLDYADDNWRDSANHDFQYMIEQDLSFASEIPYYFRQWIITINMNTNILPIFPLNSFDTSDLFLNFNYTNTLENIYKIPSNNILYIHGNALRGDKLILGHHDTSLFQGKMLPSFNAAEEHGMYMESEDEDFRLQEAREIIKDYFRKTYKDTISIIKCNQLFFQSLTKIKEIIVIGHSLSNIDFDYFLEIKKFVVSTCRWHISYYSDVDLCNAQNFAQKLGLSFFDFFHL